MNQEPWSRSFPSKVWPFFFFASLLILGLLVLFFFQPHPSFTIAFFFAFISLVIFSMIYERRITTLQSHLLDMKIQLDQGHQDLAHASNVDHLTNLPHRETMQVFLHQYLEIAKRKSLELGVLEINLDHFHDINDHFGPEKGDSLLKIISGRLKRALRKSDLIGRFGADEFLAILPDPIDANSSALVAQKIMEAIGVPLEAFKHKHMTASIGIALFPKDGQDCQELLAAATHACEVAKAHGRNRFELFNKSVQQEWERRVQHTHGLHQALNLDEFSLFFQPKVDKNKKITGAEALIRWFKGPHQEIILPNNFIPLAEETGLIVPIGYWVIAEACRQYRKWRADGMERIKISVNVSSLQLKDPQFLEKLIQILEDSKMDPKDLELEITESALVNKKDHVLRLLADLHTLGISISIDDFGTGYSNLSKLSSLPLDILKVDKSFIDPLLHDPRARSITKLIIQMAQSLGLKVVAEGVETEDQFTLLQEWGCAQVQGYLFSPPLPAMEFRKLLDIPLEKVP